MKKLTNKQIRELIIYIAQQGGNDRLLGVTKLNKILFFADFWYYLNNRESLTGLEYIKDKHGPVPVGIDEIRENMIGNEEIAIAHTRVGMYEQKRIVALKEPSLNTIDAKRLAFLTRIIMKFCDNDNSKTARELSDFSHGFMGWVAVKRYETIPYQTIYIENKDKQILTKEEIEFGKQIAQRYAKQAS